MIIGFDAYWKLVKPGVRNSNVGLVAQETVFGWMVPGSLPSEYSSVRSVAHQLLCFDVSESMLHRLWDLESLDISSGDPIQSDPVLDTFNQSCTFENGRYVVSLPWKQGKQGSGRKLPNNGSLAQKRLDSLSKRLSYVILH